MNYKIILFLLLSISISCNTERTEKIFSFNELYVGLNSFEVFKMHKKDSLKYIPPPSPVFDQEIANNNIIESNDGRIYLYSFPMKERGCGGVRDGDEHVVEWFMSNLDTLKPNNLKLLNSNNIDSVIQQLGTNKDGIFASIGIQSDSTDNELLIKLANLLYHHSVKNVWKVRRINNKEKALLKQKVGTSS